LKINLYRYIPLSIYDLQAWTGNPAIYVFDCSGAGLVGLYKLNPVDP
jgi:regulator-associated protein of mTOR